MHTLINHNSQGGSIQQAKKGHAQKVQRDDRDKEGPPKVKFTFYMDFVLLIC